MTETLSDKIKAMTKEHYLKWGSSIPDVWAESKRIDFIKAKDVKEFMV